MTRRRKIYSLILLVTVIGLLIWNHRQVVPPTPPLPHVESQPPPQLPAPSTAAESLLEGYADPATPPIEDLRKIHRVVTGYFSVVKDSSRNPIGGNADLAAALQGENPNREVLVRKTNPVFSSESLLIDRWGTPLVVHPEAWRQLTLRSAGPDKTPYTDDDLVLTPAGIQPQQK